MEGRKVSRHGLLYALDLSEYMEWVIYFDLNVEYREKLYPLVKDGMVVLDVGGNIGETALNFAKITGPTGKVISFEPVPDTYLKCVRNLSLNNFSWLKVEQLALSDRNEQLYFDPSSYPNNGGIYMRRDTARLEFSVKARPLDEYIAAVKLPKVDLIKIDVEGFEFNVLKGALNTLNSMKPLLFVEINDHNLGRQHADAKQIFDLLSESGYRIFCEGAEMSSPPANPHYDIIAKSIQ